MHIPARIIRYLDQEAHFSGPHIISVVTSSPAGMMGATQYAQELGFAEAEPLQKIPELDFGEQGFVSGNTGCNQMSGQASITANTLTLGPLRSTRMYCPGFSGELELQLLRHYDSSLAITRTEKSLVLQAGITKLEYKLKDWVQ